MRPGFWQILLVIVLLVVLFGSNKIPEMMKNLAGGINVFKKELKDEPAAKAEKKVAVKSTSTQASKKSALKVAKSAPKKSAKAPVKKAAKK